MGVLLLAVQILSFLLLFLLSNLFTLFTSPFLSAMLVAGITVGALALLHIGRASYSPLPKPRRTNRLSQRGVYRYIRHPMYAGLMLMGTAFLLSRLTPLSGFAYLLFIAATNSKANLEERLILKRHPRYAQYALKAKKYIPFVY